MLEKKLWSAAVVVCSFLSSTNAGASTGLGAGQIACPSAEDYLFSNDSIDDLVTESTQNSGDVENKSMLDSLSNNQRLQCGILKQNYNDAISAKIKNLQPLQNKLCELLSADEINEPAVLNVHKCLTGLDNELSDVRLKFFLDVEAVLTPEQRARIKQDFLVPVSSATAITQVTVNGYGPDPFELLRSLESGTKLVDTKSRPREFNTSFDADSLSSKISIHNGLFR